jgi:hypothetical protein
MVMDANYKTNALKLPFVNLVGVNNVGCNDKTLSTFAIAGGWIATEDTTHYTWFLEQLANVVYMDGKCLPSLFVTDQSQPLITAINNVFPFFEPHTLLYPLDKKPENQHLAFLCVRRETGTGGKILQEDVPHHSSRWIRLLARLPGNVGGAIHQ